MSKIAIVQHAPVLGNRTATLEKAVALIEEAAAAGAQIVILPEAFVPGYPTWIWRLRPGGDGKLSGDIHALLVANAVDIEAGHLAPICAAAKRLQVTVMCGIDELDSANSRSTLFNTYVHVNPEGRIVNRHRKLIPTNPERMVWGGGDAGGLRVIDTPHARVGSLICWENYMPLARMALYAEGVELLLAPTWDSSDNWIATMQHIAREGGCYVASCCTAMRASDIPDDFPGRAQLFGDENEVINPGRSILVAPGGDIVVGPQADEQVTLFGEIDTTLVARARRSLDVAGHYNRSDVFKLEVDRSTRAAATFGE